jgi:hypothetical protein
MGIEGTRKKLDQVEYNLGLMERAARAIPVDAREFEHALSGFLQAGRNLTFALEAEAKAEKDAWFPGWHAALPESTKQLLKQMNTQRVADVHQGGAVTSSTLNYVPVTSIPGVTQPYQMAGSFGPPDVVPEKVGRLVHHFADGPTLQEALPRCRKYAAVLRKLVEEFLDAHPHHR